MIYKFILFTVCYAFSLNAYSADADCSTKKKTLEIVNCHANRYSVADKKLNSIYSAALKNLEEDQKKALKVAQLAWLKYRDLNFALLIEMNKDTGSYSNVSIANFKANFVQQRVSELKELFTGPGDAPDWLK